MSSTFEVTIRKIDRIWPHPAADRLELAAVTGLTYQFCIGKGIYKVGDLVVYFPVDSLLPQDIIDKLGLWGKDESGTVIRDSKGRVAKTFLSGRDQNKVKTVQLRGEISQGMVTPLTEFPEIVGQPEGTDVKEQLGVTKSDPPDVMFPGAIGRPMPESIGIYDIEGADNYQDIVARLMDQPVCITEKIEGTNHTVAQYADGRILILSRTLGLEEIPGTVNTYWETARKQDFISLLREVGAYPQEQQGSLLGLNGLVALRSEMIGPGIQKNIYGLNGHELRCFDIKVGSRYLDVADWLRMVPERYRVPVLSVGITLRKWLDGRTLQEASNGKSVLNPAGNREGIVIRPMTEQRVPFGTQTKLSRLIIKQRSPVYLAKEQD